jgi:hypothetical protein
MNRRPDEPMILCYTSPFPLMFSVAAKRYAAVLVLLFLASPAIAQQEPASTSASSASSSLQPVAEDFVQQVLARAGSPSTVSISFENLSSLPPGEQAAAKQAITAGLRKTGVRMTKPELAQSDIDVTFSEDWQSYVWVANIRQGPSSQLVIKKVPRPHQSSGRSPTLTIKRSLFWEQDTAILDFYSDGQNLFVLEPEQLSLYVNDAGKWRAKSVLAISHEHPWPRDVRGRLQVYGLQIGVFLPGAFCTGTSAPPALQCRSSDDPWQIDQPLLAAFFSPNRNFFTGVLAGESAGESVPPFFSAAAAQNGGSRQWVFAGTDGRARIYLNNMTAEAATVSDWGSNLAALHSNCGSGWQVLVTLPTDLTHADSVQAFEIEGRGAVPASLATDMDGPVLALWTGENRQSTHAVVQSLATGKYEAWSLTVACN